MRKAAPRRRDNERAHSRVGRGGSWCITLILSRPGVKVSSYRLLVGIGVAALSVVIMHGHLRLKQRNKLLSTLFTEVVQAQTGALSGMHRHSTLKVGQRKRALAVASISGAKQRKQRGILADGQYLAVTKSPALGRKTKGKNSDLGYKGIGHD